MNAKLIYWCLLFSLCTSCYTTSNSTQSSQKGPLPDIIFSVDTDNDGTYEIIDLQEENIPEPLQGKSQWTRDFYGAIKYPAIARENGIKGTIILEVNIDQFGKLSQVKIKESLSKECDKEALRAYRQATQQGYTPLKINNQATKFRMELPVRFWLE